MALKHLKMNKEGTAYMRKHITLSTKLESGESQSVVMASYNV
jgi:hypothetical protein